MAVAVAHHADPVAALERVRQKPLEGPPIRVQLDRPFERAVMRLANVRIAAADMGNAYGILVSQGTE